MKSWTWSHISSYPSFWLGMRFDVNPPQSPTVNELVDTVSRDLFTKVPNEVIESMYGDRDYSESGQPAKGFMRLSDQRTANHYYDTFSYSRLPCFTGRGYFACFYHLMVCDDIWEVHLQGGMDRSPQHAEVQGLLKTIVGESQLRVVEWSIYNGCIDANMSELIAAGDHQALLEHLGMN